MLHTLLGVDSEWRTATGAPDPFPTVGRVGRVGHAPAMWQRTVSAPGPCGEHLHPRWDPALLTHQPGRSYPVSGSPCLGGADWSRTISADAADSQSLPQSSPRLSLNSDELDHMMHVACEIAGQMVELMVDTGAQMSIMTLPMVQRLGITSFIDQSEMGIASGVGVALIVGRLRGVPVRLGQVQIAMDFGVLHIKDSFAMLGMDQLQRFKCVLDMEARTVRFGGALGGYEVPFLPAHPRPPLHFVDRGAPCTVM